MFKVYWKQNPEVVKTVYATRNSPYSSEELLQFLIYYDTGRWMWVPADDYAPVI